MLFIFVFYVFLYFHISKALRIERIKGIITSRNEYMIYIHKKIPAYSAMGIKISRINDCCGAIIFFMAQAQE